MPSHFDSSEKEWKEIIHFISKRKEAGLYLTTKEMIQHTQFAPLTMMLRKEKRPAVYY